MAKPTYNRVFLLMAEFGTVDIPLSVVAPKYLGIQEERVWKRKAAMQELPFPVFRADSQKAPWMVSVMVLADYLDQREAVHAKDWHAMNDGRPR